MAQNFQQLSSDRRSVRRNKLLNVLNSFRTRVMGGAEQLKHVANDTLESQINVGAPAVLVCPPRLQWQRCHSCLLGFFLVFCF